MFRQQYQSPALGGGSDRGSHAYPMSPDPTLPDVSWLEQLPAHPIFNTPAGPSTDATVHDGADGERAHLMCVRNSDIVLATGRELRIASLVDVKHGPAVGRHTRGSANMAGSYKTLSGTDISFEIRQIVTNPTGKLLAVAGSHQVAIVVLPRPGYSKQVGSEIETRSIHIGRFYHSPHGSPRIAKVEWHPWGDGGTSLLVLTEDGMFREYDIAHDSEEPQQVFCFGPNSTSQPPVSASRHASSRSRESTPTAASYSRGAQASSSRFGLALENNEDQQAVSFCLGMNDRQTPSLAAPRNDNGEEGPSSTSTQEANWTPITVFGLMRNGDVWAICPFMPMNAVVPPAYIHALSNYASLRSQTESENASSSSAQQSELQLKYLNSLVKQLSAQREADRAMRRSVTPSGGPLLGRARTKTRSFTPGSVMEVDRASEMRDEQEGFDDDAGLDIDTPVRVHPPTTVRQQVAPQGPFLMTPAPVELSDEVESKACDIFYLRVTSAASSGGKAQREDLPQPSVGIIGIVSHDGRVDVCLAVEHVEAKWRTAPVRPRSEVRSNRYGLSQSFDWGVDEPTDADELPSLLVYETIDLGLLDTLEDVSLPPGLSTSDALSSNHPVFVKDPLYEDIVYVYHQLGAHCLAVRKWTQPYLKALSHKAGSDSADGAADSRERALTRVLHRNESTEVVWVLKTQLPSAASGTNRPLPSTAVVAVAVVSDVYLSYSFLALTAELQLVALELNLRIINDDVDGEWANDTPSSITDGAGRGYVSLLGSGPAFVPPDPFKSVSGLPSQPLLAGSNTGLGGKAELKVTPETLRFLGKTVERFRGEIRDVVRAGNAVQGRLDVQVREMQRQLERLADIRRRTAEVREGTDGAAPAGTSKLEQRLARVSGTQRELVSRTDRILQRLMDAHHPSLSVYERKWFEELERMASEFGINGKERINGQGHSQGQGQGQSQGQGQQRELQGLQGRAAKLEYQLSLLRPSLRSLAEKRAHNGSISTNARAKGQNQTLGAAQLAKVQRLLSEESAMLMEARAKVQDLNRKVARAGG